MKASSGLIPWILLKSRTTPFPTWVVQNNDDDDEQSVMVSFSKLSILFKAFNRYWPVLFDRLIRTNRHYDDDPERQDEDILKFRHRDIGVISSPRTAWRSLAQWLQQS